MLNGYGVQDNSLLRPFKDPMDWPTSPPLRRDGTSSPDCNGDGLTREEARHEVGEEDNDPHDDILRFAIFGPEGTP